MSAGFDRGKNRSDSCMHVFIHGCFHGPDQNQSKSWVEKNKKNGSLD